MAAWDRLVRAGKSRLASDRFNCGSGERQPLRTQGDGDAGYSGEAGGRDGRMHSERRSSNDSGSSRYDRISRNSGSSRGYSSMAGVRVAGAVMFALVLTGFVGIFSSVKNAETPAGPAAAASMPAPDEIKATTVGNGESASKTTTRTAKPGLGMMLAEEERKGTRSGVPGGAGNGAGVATTKPNVFFIMVDDMGWNDIGYQSTDLVGVTPNMDKLAAGGVKLTEYYTMSICTPSRASLMTGRYPIRYGLQYNVIQPASPWGLPLTEKLLPEYLRDAGYESHMVGKWHLGSYRTPYTPHRRGFETYLGYLNDKEMYWSHQPSSIHLHGRKFFDFGFGNATDYYDIIDRTSDPRPPHPVRVDDDDYDDDDADDDDFFTGATTTSMSSSSISVKGKYSTTVFQERAMEVIKDKTPFDEEPLFLYLSHQAVHDPLGLPPSDAFTAEDWAILDALEEQTGSTLRVRFAKVMMYMDKTIGELVSYLEQEGWMENSIIALASDNGGCPLSGGSNYPLRGMKHSYWEGAVKVPAFVYSTSHIPEEAWGTEYANMVHVTDWLPTLASAVGVELTGSHGDLDGIDHWAQITSPDLVASSDAPRTEMLYNFDPYVMWADVDTIEQPDYPLAQGAYRRGKWKYIFNEWCQGYYTFDKNILTSDYLTDANNTCQDGGSCDDCSRSCVDSATAFNGLFDLEADPREEHNLIDLYPEVADGIRKRLDDVITKEYTDSLYEDMNHDSYYVWAAYNWWMMPWYDILAEGFPTGSED